MWLHPIIKFVLYQNWAHFTPLSINGESCPHHCSLAVFPVSVIQSGIIQYPKWDPRLFIIQSLLFLSPGPFTSHVFLSQLYPQRKQHDQGNVSPVKRSWYVRTCSFQRSQNSNPWISPWKRNTFRVQYLTTELTVLYCQQTQSWFSTLGHSKIYIFPLHTG